MSVDVTEGAEPCLHDCPDKLNHTLDLLHGMKEDITKRLVQAESYLKARKDIAVYLIEGKFADKRLEILGDLIDIFKTDRLDLVILNRAEVI